MAKVATDTTRTDGRALRARTHWPIRATTHTKTAPTRAGRATVAQMPRSGRARSTRRVTTVTRMITGGSLKPDSASSVARSRRPDRHRRSTENTAAGVRRGHDRPEQDRRPYVHVEHEVGQSTQ